MFEYLLFSVPHQRQQYRINQIKRILENNNLMLVKKKEIPEDDLIGDRNTLDYFLKVF